MKLGSSELPRSASQLFINLSSLGACLLPCRLGAGHVKSLCVRIPWQSLGRQPVAVSVDGLHILVGPREEWEVRHHQGLATGS